MQSDVWYLLTWIDDDGTAGTSRTTGSKYLEYNPGSELKIFSFEQRTMKSKESNENKIRTNMNKNWMKVEQQ